MLTTQQTNKAKECGNILLRCGREGWQKTLDDVQYLTRVTVIEINRLLGYGGALRDDNLLESALAAPKNAGYYEGADLVTQAATLIERLALNHPFIDGNKRTALIAGSTFLFINSFYVVYKDEMDEAAYGIEIELLVAKKDFRRFMQWFEAHIQPYEGGYVDEEG
ncbi:MAG: type II toxin-antitoxin system death-on-curing family toxin [Ktedonobacteraceae bacterium]|nr:type II toxin-antitoxin system death-on-curing family toxin [Ktedonobacteraceae bacterium]